MKTFLDTNLLIRFVTNDVPHQAKKARQVIGEGKNLYLPGIILAETVFILEKHYQVNKNDVCKTLQAILNQPQIESPDYLSLAVGIYREESISFYDCLLIAETIKRKATLQSFDEKLIRVWEKRR